MRTICALRLFAVVTIAALASGCASITSSDIQQLNLTTHTADGKPVEKAKCTVRNDKGHWESESPAFVQIRRSAEDLLVECKKEGHQNGFLRAISRAAGGMFGNIIFGGGIGAIIDHSRGTGYNYPDNLPVKMGQSVVIDRRGDDAAPAAQATAQGAAKIDSAQSPATSAAENQAVGKVLTGSELANLFRNTLDFKVLEPAGMNKIVFRTNGHYDAEFLFLNRSGAHRLVPSSNQVCIQFDWSNNLPSLDGCYTVSHIAGKRYRFSSTDRQFMIIGDL